VLVAPRARLVDIAEYISFRDIMCDMAEPKKRLIRLPRELDARLEKAAEAEGASVNTFITAILAAAVGYKRPK
jgi:predicted HicB family RNase H-like nuclease